MNSHKITKKVVVKPVPPKKKEVVTPKTYIVEDAHGEYIETYLNVTDVNAALEAFEDYYGKEPRFLHEVSKTYSISRTSKFTLTEEKNNA